MLTIYTFLGCSNCKKLKQFLKDKEIPYTEKNMYVTLLNSSELKKLISFGKENIVNAQSDVLKERNIIITNMEDNQFITFIQNNPSIIIRPLIVDQEGVLNKYNDVFVGNIVKIWKQKKCKEDCSNYYNCEQIRK